MSWQSHPTNRHRLIELPDGQRVKPIEILADYYIWIDQQGYYNFGQRGKDGTVRPSTQIVPPVHELLKSLPTRDD